MVILSNFLNIAINSEIYFNLLVYYFCLITICIYNDLTHIVA